MPAPVVPPVLSFGGLRQQWLPAGRRQQCQPSPPSLPLPVPFPVELRWRPRALSTSLGPRIPWRFALSLPLCPSFLFTVNLSAWHTFQHMSSDLAAEVCAAQETELSTARRRALLHNSKFRAPPGMSRILQRWQAASRRQGWPRFPEHVRPYMRALRLPAAFGPGASWVAYRWSFWSRQEPSYA